MNTEVILMNDLISGVYPFNRIDDYDFHLICNGDVAIQWKIPGDAIELHQTREDRLITVLPIIRDEIYVVSSEVGEKPYFPSKSSTYIIREMTIENTYWEKLLWVLGLTAATEVLPGMERGLLEANPRGSLEGVLNQMLVFYPVPNCMPQNIWYVKMGIMTKERLIEILRAIVYRDVTILEKPDRFDHPTIIRRAAILLEMLVNGNVRRKILY